MSGQQKKHRRIWQGVPLVSLWIVSLAVLGMIVASVFQTWDRPVSALSGLAPHADNIAVMTGEVLDAPTGKYAEVNLRPGDRIVRYDGRDWQETQRLNWHEFSGRQPGEQIELLVERQGRRIAVQLPVTAPDAWERFVLLRYALSAFFCWLPTVFILWKLTQAHRQQAEGGSSLPVEDSVLVVWVLAFQLLSVAHALASFKYPVTVLWTDALTPVITLLIGMISLPYPLAAHARRPRWITYSLLGLAGAAFAAIIWNALQSPFPSSDWRRGVQLLRSNDPITVFTGRATMVGVACAVGGMIAVACSPWMIDRVGMLRHWEGWNAHRVRKAAHWFVTTYYQCPTTIQVIAQFQLMIISIYLLFDQLPRVLGGVGKGYSVLFGGIPITYILLYSDGLVAKRWGPVALKIIIGLVAVIQLPNQSYRLWVGSYGTGANDADIATLLIVAWGTVGAALLIALYHVFRRREAPLSALIDRLFSPEMQGSQQALWGSLVNDVGRYVGTSAWLWAVLSPTNEWRVIAEAGAVRATWLDDPRLHNELAKLAALRPVSLHVGTLELPTFLVVLPVYRHQGEIEVWIVVNPQQVVGVGHLMQREVHERLQTAVSALRRIEEQRAIAAEKERLASTIEQLRRQQQTTARLDYLYADARLHRGPLGELVRLARDLDQQGLPEVSGRIVEIQQGIRDILQNLGTYLVREQLLLTIQRRIERWEERYPGVLLFLNATEEPNLDQEQREAMYEIICQAVENALQHGQATEVAVLVRQHSARLVVEISDNGKGFVYDRARVMRGEGVEGRQGSHTPWGLLIMHILAERMDGHLTIESSPGMGCRVVVELPDLPA